MEAISILVGTNAVTSNGNNKSHLSIPESHKTEPPTISLDGLQSSRPFHVNALGPVERRKLDILLRKISLFISKHRILLLPYFQDYEENFQTTKNSGTVTITHFGRILYFLGITLGIEEFSLLIKSFAVDHYAVNYQSFLKALESTFVNIESTDELPERIISVKLPKLPRPEIGKVYVTDVFENQTSSSVFHPVLERKREKMPLVEIIKRIQRHIFEERIAIHGYFKSFDYFNNGKITVSQFRRGLDSICVSSLGRLYLLESEIKDLINFYKDPKDCHQVSWRKFENDINRVFTVNGLDKCPTFQFQSPPKEILDLEPRGRNQWENLDCSIQDICENVLSKIRLKINERGIVLRPIFQDFDKLNHGHVTRSQLRQVLSTIIILLSSKEIQALEGRYNDQEGFDYISFLRELEARRVETPLYDSLLEKKKLINDRKSADKAESSAPEETNIILILAKIKAKVTRERIKIWDFLRPLDFGNKRVIAKNDFIRGLDQIRCNLTAKEVETIVNYFKDESYEDEEMVEYGKFVEAAEPIYTKHLEHDPLFQPVSHVPSESCDKNFLTFEERQVLSGGLEKLAKIRHHNLEELFSDYDKENMGTVSMNQLIQTFAIRNMLHFIGKNEIDVIFKCFSIERGLDMEFDYLSFLRTLYFMQENNKVLRF